MAMRWVTPVNVGDVFSTAKGNSVQVLEVKSAIEICVKFLDGTDFIKWTRASELHSGVLKSPFDKTFCGVGYLGVGKYRGRVGDILSVPYIRWTAMMTRCYRQYKMHPSYFDKSVDPIWHNFQNFAEWWETNPYKNSGWDLDKDIIKSGNTVYGPEYCAIVPTEINRSFTASVDDAVSKGVFQRDNKFWAKGFPKTYSFQEAKQNHLKRKRDLYNEMREKYDGRVDPRVFTGYNLTLEVLENNFKKLYG